MKIDVNKYPWGKYSKSFENAVLILNKLGTQGFNQFDYPEYANLPKRISGRLSPDEVDYIQMCWN